MDVPLSQNTRTRLDSRVFRQRGCFSSPYVGWPYRFSGTIGSMVSTTLTFLKTFSWQELQHNPWRNLAAAVAVMLGVALAFSVHLINASALSEFSQAVRSVNGQPDLELRGVQGTFDEAVFERVASHPQVKIASPVLELSSYAVLGDGKRSGLRVVGVDALVIAQISPALMPVPGSTSNDTANAERFSLFTPGFVFLNASARQNVEDQATFKLQSGLQLLDVKVAGSVSTGGAALAVMDIAAAQELFDKRGQLSRVDVRLVPGADRAAFIQSLQLPPGITATEPGDDAQRVSNLSRAYRVNLTVLALVALFTGAFLVFSVLSLSVAKRAQQFALLGVLGLTGRERHWWVAGGRPVLPKNCHLHKRSRAGAPRLHKAAHTGSVLF